MKMNPFNRNLTVLATVILGLTIQANAAIIGFEAESGALGSDLATTSSVPGSSGSYVYTTANNLYSGYPNSANTIVTYSEALAAGTYDLYARFYTNSAGDDSFFPAVGFGTKNPTDDADWYHVNQLEQSKNAFVDPDGTEITNGTWNWLNLTDTNTAIGSGTENVGSYTSSGATETFQYGHREDGFLLDAFAFVTGTETPSVADLDAALLPKLNWIGGTGDDWSTDANWDGSLASGNIMNIGTDTAAAGNVSLNSDFSAAAVNIGTASGKTSSLNIASGKTLTVTDSPLTIGDDGTLKGKGKIVGEVTITGNVSPGNSIGTITVENGPATFAAGSAYNWEFDGSSADLIAIDGDLVFDNAGNITITAMPLNGEFFRITNATYDLFTFTGSFEDDSGTPVSIDSANILTYVNLIQSGGLWTDFGTLEVNGNTVQLVGFSLIPEPSTAILAGIGLMGVCFRRRRQN